MSGILKSLAYLAIISAPVAVVCWFVNWNLLVQAKRDHLTPIEREALKNGDINVSFLLAFTRSASMRADKRITRLTTWARVLFFWPIGAVLFAALLFRLLGINQT